ncbi:hypothetical protein JTE90_018702 [Oedothorax gibbosus]|uniref:Cytochrome P450 n=1 Tax=Oedothorax gibbosus TaxID=931172 RepID=A0AAV6U090_9ARAC|nr:hypothetical protein JTE90_018702 [Oedothorax gibbosus]
MFGLDLSSSNNWLPILGVTFAYLLYRFSTRKHDFWKKQGVTYIRPVPFLGCLIPFMRKPAHEVERENYTKYGLIYGSYIGHMPSLSVGDPDLIREILVKEFQTFNSRVLMFDGYSKMMDNMMSCMKGDENWKRIRSIVAPTFATKKIKNRLGELRCLVC